MGYILSIIDRVLDAFRLYCTSEILQHFVEYLHDSSKLPVCHIMGPLCPIAYYKKNGICYRLIVRVNIKSHLCHRDYIFWITIESRLGRIPFFLALRISWILRASSTNTPFLLITYYFSLYSHHECIFCPAITYCM